MRKAPTHAILSQNCKESFSFFSFLTLIHNYIPFVVIFNLEVNYRFRLLLFLAHAMLLPLKAGVYCHRKPGEPSLIGKFASMTN